MELGQAAQAVTPEPGITQPPDHPPSCPQAQQTWPRERRRCQPLSHGGAGPHLCRPLGPAGNHSPSPPDTWSDQGPGCCPGSHVHDAEAGSGRTKGGRALHTRAPTLGSASTDPLVSLPSAFLEGAGAGQVEQRAKPPPPPQATAPWGGQAEEGLFLGAPSPSALRMPPSPPALVQRKEFGGTRKKIWLLFSKLESIIIGG